MKLLQGDAMTVETLEAALTAAFPSVTIDRAMIDEPTANWNGYDDLADIAGFERKTWRDLPMELLVRHSTLPIFAGDMLFRATLPGYLRYLLRERDQFNDLPYQLASQLTRKDDPAYHPKFDRRVASFTQEQRAVVRDVVAYLATKFPMEDPMSRALITWNNL